jgi:hypothetical protein
MGRRLVSFQDRLSARILGSALRSNRPPSPASARGVRPLPSHPGWYRRGRRRTGAVLVTGLGGTGPRVCAPGQGLVVFVRGATDVAQGAGAHDFGLCHIGPKWCPIRKRCFRATPPRASHGATIAKGVVSGLSLTFPGAWRTPGTSAAAPKAKLTAELIKFDPALLLMRAARRLDQSYELRIGRQRERFPVGAGDILDRCERFTLPSQDDGPLIHATCRHPSHPARPTIPLLPAGEVTEIVVPYRQFSSVNALARSMLLLLRVVG